MPQTDPIARCIGRIPVGRGRFHFCRQPVVADGFCAKCHPIRLAERKALRQQLADTAMAREVCHVALHDLWCQVAICALMQFLQKAAPEWSEALEVKLKETM